MSFLSVLATIVAVLLMAFGVNLTALVGGEPAPVATVAPAAATDAPQPDASVSPDPSATAEATAEPTPEPSAQPTSGAEVVDGFISRDDAEADVQTLATGMYAGIMSGAAYARPEILADTDATHLALRWVDYETARYAVAGDDKLTAFARPGVVPQTRAMFMEGELIVAQVDCALSLKTASGGDVNTRLTFVLKYEQSGDSGVIVALEIVGDDDYDALRAQLADGADSAAIDAAVDAAIAALGE